MSEHNKLTKPQFIKLEDIRPNKHCYNVYGVITALKFEETLNQKGQTVKVANGKLADETGTMDFKLRDDHLANLKVGAVVAFRNGKSIMDEECIHMEMDKFGKVSLESVKIETNNKKDLS